MIEEPDARQDWFLYEEIGIAGEDIRKGAYIGERGDGRIMAIHNFWPDENCYGGWRSCIGYAVDGAKEGEPILIKRAVESELQWRMAIARTQTDKSKMM